MNIQWYPGHMTKTRRQMAEYIKQVDAVCEVVDARIPQVSRNPDMDEIAAGRPRMMILNRIDLADPNKTAVWAKHFRDQGMAVIQTDSRAGTGTQAFSNAVRTLLADKIEQWNEKGLVGKAVRVMVVGIPNVGKSTFINRILGRRSAKAADRPGVTRGSQWFRVDSGIDLLDTPGILWPKFDDERVGILLACTGAIKDDILDVETLGCKLMELLAEQAPQTIIDRGQEWFLFGSDYTLPPKTAEEMIAIWDAGVEEGAYWKADTLDELADQLGLDAAKLKDVVARYNELCKKGVDEDFYKDPTYLVEIEETGPYYAAKNTCTFMTIMGGLRTSVNMEVCDENDEPIPGLFNVGCMVGDMYANEYNFAIPGNSYGINCLTFGYMLGHDLAAGKFE